jgi:hypothetical protein
MPVRFAGTTLRGRGLAGIEGAIAMSPEKHVDDETGEAEQIEGQRRHSDLRRVGFDAGRKADDDPQRHGRAREDLRGVHFVRCDRQEAHDRAAAAYVAIMVVPNIEVVARRLARA